MDSSRAASISSKQTEGRRFQVLDRKKQGNSRECLLSAGEQNHVLQLLAWRLGDDADACLKDILPFHKLQLAVAAAEELAESLVKLLSGS